MSLDKAYNALVGLEHRRQKAQFFTPSPIASFMVDWVLGGEGKRKIHDPAFGLGAFFCNAPIDCDFTGGDVDDAILSFFLEHSQRRPSRLERVDYLLEFDAVYDNIVCNPPYLRFQKFSNRETVSKAFAERLGVKLSGYTNIASAFLVKSISELKAGGRLAYILPSEFLNAGYGRMVKEWLIRDRHLDSIIEIECEREAFEEVTTSICIVLFDSARVINAVSFRKVTSISALQMAMVASPVCTMDIRQLDPSEKWARFFVPAEDRVAPTRHLLQSLSAYGRFSRGIATGANSFFVLTKSGIRENGIPYANCKPCITKSHQLRTPIFTDNDFERLSDDNAAVYLFSPAEKPDAASLEYIRKGESMGYDRGYITRHREPWYKTERREASPLLVNVFSRSGYKVVRNYSSALTLTNFHCFYSNGLYNKYIDGLFLYLHSAVGRKILSLAQRKYGNALDKFEPNDLNAALVPTQAFFDSLDGEELIDIMDAIRRGDDVASRLNAVFKPLLGAGRDDIAKDEGWSVVTPERRPLQLRLAL